MRLIDGDALYKAMQDAEDLARQRVLDTESTLPYPNNLNPSYTRYLAQMDERTKAKEMVADAPTVDAVTALKALPSAQKKGHWIDEGTNYFCSECHRGCWVNSNYCPWCGARMDWKDGEAHGAK